MKEDLDFNSMEDLRELDSDFFEQFAAKEKTGLTITHGDTTVLDPDSEQVQIGRPRMTVAGAGNGKYLHKVRFHADIIFGEKIESDEEEGEAEEENDDEEDGKMTFTLSQGSPSEGE